MVRLTTLGARTAAAALVTALVSGLAPARLAAQSPTTADVRAAVLADLEVMRGKFVGLAEAFPQDKYAWRPMDGVRSVAEVLMLSAMEGYALVPRAFGGTPASLGSQEEMAKLRALADKPAVIEHINKGFAHAKAQLTALDDATLGAARPLFGQTRTAPGLALTVLGDMHEHLGQLIAYARVNGVVPPWSR